MRPGERERGGDPPLFKILKYSLIKGYFKKPTKYN
jgi:hypothetical protein